MPSIRYNDMQFSVEPSGDRWDITYQLPSGASALPRPRRPAGPWP